ncbi:MAG: hypothetical protein KC433_03225, partial [Anaerolineales bacterium]|nr:hypothetical protein [Anaerolineales bacterium]
MDFRLRGITREQLFVFAEVGVPGIQIFFAEFVRIRGFFLFDGWVASGGLVRLSGWFASGWCFFFGFAAEEGEPFA